MLLLAACGSKKKDAAVEGGRDAARAVAPDAAVAGPELGFVKGSVYVAEEGGIAKALEGGAWRELGKGVFPSGHRWKGGLLVILAEGEDAADHVEQLAVLRDRPEPFGPTAQMVRNPVVAGDVLVVETNLDGFRELYRIDAAAKRLTNNPEGNFEPALSADGKTLAFVSSRDGDSEIYRMPSGGGTATRLTAFHLDDWSPIWAPDGTIVFLSDREGRPRLFGMNADGTNQHRLTSETSPDAIEDLPRVAPDGKTLAYTRSIGTTSVVHLLDVATGKATPLTPPEHSDRDLAWSPDGAYLAVIRHPIASGKLGRPALVFVRISDNVAVADPRVAPFLVRWL